MEKAKRAAALYMLARVRQRASRTLRDLRRRLNEEMQRVEHARIVRVRHYLTADCIPKPEAVPWMYIWLFGSDENFMNIISLCRYYQARR
jgi:hypothetical protein